MIGENVGVGLTPEERERYDRDGFLVRPAVFSEAEVARMRAEADYVLELLINSALSSGRPNGRIDVGRGAEGGVHVRKVQPINDVSLYFSQVSDDPRLLGPLAELMGSEPRLMEEKLNYKQPVPNWPEQLPVRDKEDSFAPHNDWAYYSMQGYPQDIVSSMITMDDCTVDNGPLVLWPGSHRAYLEHVKGTFDLHVAPGLIDETAGEDLLVPAGSIVFFHALLIHSSRPNSTAQPRRLMIYSHYPGREDHGTDVRNGPARLRESPWERDYLRKLIDGEARPTFRLYP